MYLFEMAAIGGDNLAPTGGLYNSYLHRRGELGLTLETINGLADRCQQYTGKILGIFLEMTALAGDIDQGLQTGRHLGPDERAELRRKVARRNTLSLQAEQLYLDTVLDGQDLLAEEQLRLFTEGVEQERERARAAVEAGLRRPALL
ncbi:hypothetical protein MXD59_21260 [Frankia sp. Ag45/Mut15]|uniref:Uncharacterized protein n=1 Tax=Frankia umida TaxID=573489 RepID=A0ABT0K381_9ACTN|nr:hypothetical protein [Frankia umida]MCK9878267.1 hypothetical protein [Frankia umida]